MTALSEKCKAHKHAALCGRRQTRLRLTCRDNDLTIQELATLCDAFYIGGTKNGALFGEALVILNDTMNDHFRWMIKRQCGLLAKGRLIGVQLKHCWKAAWTASIFPWHPMPMKWLLSCATL